MASSEQSEGEGLPCPRCESRETKFCYYNNYSTTQPRHFCRNCKRYWTAGGTLRSVPVGGGLRKNKTSKLSKHGVDLLSASTDGSHSSGNRSSLVLGSPSSSADGAVDESNAKFDSAIVPYRPTFEFETATGDCYPFGSPPFDCTNVRNFAYRNDGLLAENINLQHARDANYGLPRPQFGFGYVDQAQSSSGMVSLELSQASNNAAPRLGMYPSYSTLYTGFRENLNETGKQGNVQYCPVDNQALSHGGNPRKRPATEAEDEELGNVINVRHPYDWEQVSEVLCGGTPDFFQMPTSF